MKNTLNFHSTGNNIKVRESINYFTQIFFDIKTFNVNTTKKLDLLSSFALLENRC